MVSDISYGCNMKQKVCFKLFGDICILTSNDCWVPVTDFSAAHIGKKQLSFLTYLVVNHTRKISSIELMECFWPDKSKDPSNSLKNMMHKIRTLLRSAFPDTEELILTSPGGYEWNHNVTLEVDTDLFEIYYHEAKNLGNLESVQLERKAFELYGGDILPDEQAEWITYRNTYYRTIFVYICKSLSMRMIEEEKWNDVIQICEKAYLLAPELEEFTICSMQALVNLGMPNQAAKQYEDYCSMLWEKFSLPPSGAVEQTYSLVLHAIYDTEDTADKIINDLSILSEDRRAFLCSLPIFRNIVQLDLRHMLRNNQESTLAVLKVDAKDEAMPSSTDIRRLERTLLEGLRVGDPFIRLNQGTFVILLSGASVEMSHKVMARIKNKFSAAYPRSTANLKHRVFSLSPVREMKNRTAESELG